MATTLLNDLVHPTDLLPVEHIVCVFYGTFGLGKSTLLFSATDVYVLDFNKGAHRTEHRTGSVKRISSWKEIGGADVAAWRQVRDAGYRTVGVDTCDDMLKYMTAAVRAEKAGNGNPGGGLSPQGWGRLKKMFIDWVDAIVMAELDVVFVAHEREEKRGEDRIFRPKITGGSYSEVAERADVIGRLSRVLNAGDEDSNVDDPKTYRRQIDFEPCDDWVAKGPEGYGPINVPKIGENPRFLGKLMAELKARLGSISESSAEMAKDVETWRDAIVQLTDPREFNLMRDRIASDDELPQPVLLQVKHILWDHAQDSDIDYDRETKSFITAVADEPAVAVAEPDDNDEMPADIKAIAEKEGDMTDEEREKLAAYLERDAFPPDESDVGPDEDEPNADDEELPKPKPLKELIVVGMEVEFFVPNDTEPRIGIVKRVDAMEGMAPSALVREDGKPKSTRVPIVLGRITPLPKDEDAAPDGEPATEVGSVGKLI